MVLEINNALLLVAVESIRSDVLRKYQHHFRMGGGQFVEFTSFIDVITSPVPAEIDGADLERRLFAPAGFNRPPARIMPEWNQVHAELRRRDMTLLLLWEEYRSEHPDGYGYGRFCDL